MENQAQTRHEPAVHVYGSGRMFVVVPLALSADGSWVEMTPVEQVNIVLGRSVVAPLAQALREAKAQSTAGLQGEANRWDGDGGRWWDHRLLCVRITWSTEHIIFAPQLQDTAEEKADDLAEVMPGNLPEAKLATRLVEYLGHRLEAS